MKGFYTSVIMFVIPQQRSDSDPPQDLFFFTDILTGRNSVISFFRFSIFYFFFFRPNTVTAHVKGYTLYCIYAMWSPAQPAEVCLALVVDLRPVPSNLLWFCWRRQHSPDGRSTKSFPSPVQSHPECCFNAPPTIIVRRCFAG